MKICILAEGSYPYIFGGVSNWVSQLISDMKDVEFIIVSIMPSKHEDKEYKYILPDNVSAVHTIYLQGYKEYNPTPKKREPRLSNQEILNLKKFIRFDNSIDWDMVADSICNQDKLGNPIEFLHSRLFWDLLVEYYEEMCPEEGFNQFFWTIRSMFLFFLTIMQSQLPEADLYHAVSTGYPGLLGLIATRKYKKPFIITEHGIYAREREEDILKANWVQGIYKKMWINFFYFIASGAYDVAGQVMSLFSRSRDIQLSLGSRPEDTVVIPNGLNVKDIAVKRKKHDTLNVAAILRIVPIKDVKTMIRSFLLVNKKLANSRLYLIGPYDEDKDYYEECVELVKDLGLEEEIIFTGRADIKDYLPIIDILLLTSISEGQPLVILEGNAFGIPFVSTDVGACKEMLNGTDGDTFGPSGVIVPPVSPAETANAIVKLLKDEPLRKKMDESGKKRVRKYYKQSDLIQQYYDIYKKFVEEE